ncbi:penicillin-binding transpeptidase domain-containing protein [Cohnella ginsengisoli]|uniref:Penicillin-binding transpeptidase domain-containing protein n=1 Tax=Cohnella ginsengisoli TaxID=425004 RepID=A0A9X4KL48_9BACL|nr:penicillin-binding transpeptidase domain-containing protein [Cohnella ginsengisoli]MDG0793771.1 penicillin-binding transpeptidase domain-containing protein [Cohnella ginsengisoli]
MKLRKWAIPALLLLTVLSGCKSGGNDLTPEPTPEPTAEDAIGAYLKDWQRLDYAGMYAMLTPDARAKLTAEQFAERYGKIYEGIKADKLAVEDVSPPPASPSSASPASTASAGPVVQKFQFSVSMDTIAGPVKFKHEGTARKTPDGEEQKWRIDWDSSMIFPEMKDGDKVRVQTLASERGEIVDRTGEGLAVNGTAPQLGIVPGKLGEDPAAVKAKVAAKLGITAADIDRKLGASWVKPELFVPIGIVDEADMDAFDNVPGVLFQQKKLRVYPLGEAAAHLTGYVGEINAEQLERLKDKGYKAGDVIGKAGLEQVLEDQLRGTDGVVVAIEDASGQRKSVLAEKAAVPGTSFQLTVDAGLQKTIYEEIKADASSAAAIEPRTGEVLALLSSPSYDPNAFARGLSAKQYAAWNDDPRHPFLNRFSKGYAPGSSFKIVTAALGLDAGTLDPDKAVEISGLKWTKDGSWGSYYVKRVHAVNPVDLSKALTYSDNIYFAQAALALGKDKFAEDAAKFGIGEAIPIVYPLAKSQLSNKGLKSEIQLADSGYGQGEVTMTSLHVALAFSAIVNGGNIAYPRLTLADDPDSPQVWKAAAMTPESADILKKDLVQAVASPEGVGHGAYIQGSSIAGKTGTAELKASKGTQGEENGWFVGFDANDPKLLLAVMVEDVSGRGGSTYVTPKVKRIFQQAMKG